MKKERKSIRAADYGPAFEEHKNGNFTIRAGGCERVYDKKGNLLIVVTRGFPVSLKLTGQRREGGDE